MKKTIKSRLLKNFFIHHNTKNCVEYYETKKFFPFKIHLYKNKKLHFFAIRWFKINGSFKYLGFSFYENGKICSKGIFHGSGMLYKGTNYREDGTKRFKGICNDKHADYIKYKTDYYGPSYPVYGTYYNEMGKREYRGKFKISHHGGVGYPYVEYPENYGSIKW